MKTALLFSSLLIGGSIMLHKPVNEAAVTAGTSTHNTPVRARRNLPAPIPPIRIVVDKSSYEMYVYDAQGWFATYPVVFGNNSLDDKKVEGDRNTPEGSFRIVNKRIHDKWDRYMGLDYPTTECLQRFNERKKRGEIPSNASPGGGIGIHGTWPHEDFVIDRYKNWTNGCISLKNEDVEDLYSYIPIGTPITIKK